MTSLQEQVAEALEDALGSAANWMTNLNIQNAAASLIASLGLREDRDGNGEGPQWRMVSKMFRDAQEETGE